MSKGFQPTPEQRALADERKRKKAEKAKNAALEAAREEEERSRIFPRDWIDIQALVSSADRHHARVMSWNVRFGLFYCYMDPE